MSAALAVREGRQFGRRESNIRGHAVMSDQIRRPFTIRNISDGGALIAFDEAFIPTRSFRIEIDDTEFVLLCEVRHQGGTGIGVRFVRLAEGVALNRHFQRRQLDNVMEHQTKLPPRVARPLPVTSSRELRLALRVVPEPVSPAVPVAPPYSPRRASAWKGAALATCLTGVRLLADPIPSRRPLGSTAYLQAVATS